MIAGFACTRSQHKVAPQHNLLPYVSASLFSHASTRIIHLISSEASSEAILPHCDRTHIPCAAAVLTAVEFELTTWCQSSWRWRAELRS